MLTAILVRIGFALVSLFAMLMFVFSIVRLTGDPLQLNLPAHATPADFEMARQRLGLDRPLVAQFAIYVGQVARGDLGTSTRGLGFSGESGPPVADLIRQRIPATVALGAAAMLIVLAVGIPLGVYSAYRRGGALDRIARFLAALGQAAPSFWVGLLLILLFAVQFRVLPAGGSGGLASLVLPAVTVSFPAIAGLTRLLRSSMIEVLDTDYVRFLRVKGVPEQEILWKHALRNAGLTALTFVGVLTARFLTGSIVVETVFTWPGLGRLMIEAVQNRDFPVAQGVMLLFSSVYIGVNLLVDLLYAVLNPRLR